jgi:hypothetical protein
MSELLAQDGIDQLISTCRAAIGDNLRSITYFTHDDFTQVYLRTDLEQDADLASFIGNEWYGFENTQSSYGGTELGEYQYTLRGFENGFLLRVTTDSEGVFVTTDELSIQEFEEVATAISELLDTWEFRAEK